MPTSTHATTAATARLEARIHPDLHAMIKHAADLEGRTLTDFLVSAAQQAAQRSIDRSTMLRLSLDDQKTFVEALLNPPKPVAALKRAAARHKKLIRSDL